LNSSPYSFSKTHPAGMTDSVKDQIRRDTVKAVRDELKTIFKEHEYQYRLEDV
jgi:hypothetical protein